MLVDAEAVLADLKGRLSERSSWGLPQLQALVWELEARHRVDETADAALLRRFGDHLTDSFLGLLPGPLATIDPLAGDDPRTSLAMDAGATIRSSEEDKCQTHPQQSAWAGRRRTKITARALT